MMLRVMHIANMSLCCRTNINICDVCCFWSRQVELAMVALHVVVNCEVIEVNRESLQRV